MGRKSKNQIFGAVSAYDMIQKEAEEKDVHEIYAKKRLEDDEKYTTIVSIIYNEMKKRNIEMIDDTSTDEFNEKIDGVIDLILQTDIMKRFAKDNRLDIRNAVKRRINNSKNKSEGEGPEI